MVKRQKQNLKQGRTILSEKWASFLWYQSRWIFKEVLDNCGEGCFWTLPYVPGLSKKLKRISQRNGLKVALYSSNTLSCFLNSRNDRISVDYLSWVYQIPSTCGRSYVGRTNYNLEIWLLQHQESNSSTLKQKSKLENFASTVSMQIFIFPDLSLMFENVSLISRSWALKQIFREIIEINKFFLKNLAFDTDTGEFGVISIYDNLLQ